MIRQTNEGFVPHVVAVTAGSVEFPNDDLIFHNVFSLLRAAIWRWSVAAVDHQIGVSIVWSRRWW